MKLIRVIPSDLSNFLIYKMMPFARSDLFMDEILYLFTQINPGLLRFFIHEFMKYPTLGTIPLDQKNAFSEMLMLMGDEIEILPELQALMLAYQRVLVYQAIESLRNDIFSSIKLISEENRQNTPMDWLADYAIALTGTVLKALQGKDVCGWSDCHVLHLFDNFVLLVTGLSDFHLLAQFLLPLLALLPEAFKKTFTQLGSESRITVDATDIFM
jgi:hypothetical protein